MQRRSTETLSRLGRAATVAALLLASALSARAQDYQPPELKSGSMPKRAVLGVGGGQVLLEVTIGVDGSVTHIKPLRTTATFTELLTGVVEQWEFTPARGRAPDAPPDADLVPVESTVVVAGFFRPPVLIGPTLGEPVQNVASPSAGAPAILATSMPPYPPAAVNPGSVLAEIDIDEKGGVEVHMSRATPPFGQVAADTLRSWRFAPASAAGGPLPSRAYVFFDFPQPVLSGNGKSR